MFEIKAKLSILAASATLGITAFASTPTQAANFNLQFLDQANKEIGRGSFSADAPSYEELNLLFDGADTSKIDVGTIKTWLYIKSFQATLDRFSWDSTYANFWDPISKTFKRVNFSGAGQANFVEGALFGSQNGLGELNLILVDNSLYQILGSGKGTEGLWLATAENASQFQTSDAVPEAPTVLGSLTAIGMLTLFKRVISKRTKG